MGDGVFDYNKKKEFVVSIVILRNPLPRRISSKAMPYFSSNHSYARLPVLRKMMYG
jgi:hypothetical protein